MIERGRGPISWPKLAGWAAILLALVAALAIGGSRLAAHRPQLQGQPLSRARPAAAQPAPDQPLVAASQAPPSDPSDSQAASPSPPPSASMDSAPAQPAQQSVAPPPKPAAAPAHPPAPSPPPPPPAAGPSSTIAVPFHHQQYNLSCEEASLSMVMAFLGHPTTEQQVFDQIGIDRVHYWAGKPGGGDPFQEFVGDPNGSEVQQTGYGVYWPPIQQAATHFGATVAQAGPGVAPATVYDAVRSGHPALVWVTYDLQVHARSDYQAYDGKTIPYAGPEEHTIVVSGINANSVRVNDPDRGQYWVTFSQFEAAYAVYGQMALVFG